MRLVLGCVDAMESVVKNPRTVLHRWNSDIVQIGPLKLLRVASSIEKVKSGGLQALRDLEDSGLDERDRRQLLQAFSDESLATRLKSTDFRILLFKFRECRESGVWAFSTVLCVWKSKRTVLECVGTLSLSLKSKSCWKGHR